MTEFTKVELPKGRFIGWGRKGQQLTVKVLSFELEGGRDFHGKPCPRLTGTLVEDCDNYRDLRSVEVTHERLKAEEIVNIEGSTANLKRGLMAADPKPGDIVRLTFSDTYQTDNGPGKVIDVEIARAAQTVKASDI